jgi:hypothetical protein
MPFVHVTEASKAVWQHFAGTVPFVSACTIVAAFVANWRIAAWQQVPGRFTRGCSAPASPRDDLGSCASSAVSAGRSLLRAPIAAWNNPFKVKRGAVGRPLQRIEVPLAADGEILEKGATVTAGK